MKQMETAAILKILKMTYPYHFKTLSKEDQIIMLDLWHDALKFYEYQDVMNATKYLVQNRKSMPTIKDMTDILPAEDIWHKRFGYSDEPIYYDDDFLDTVVWNDVPKDIIKRMEFHCNPKDYERYNKIAEEISVFYGNPVRIYTDEDTENLKGKLTTWKNELQVM